MSEKSVSELIDDIINQYDGWKADIIKCLRAIIKDADPEIVEEVKYRMKTNPQGLPVWSHNGMICIMQTFKNDSKLLFMKGASLKDPGKLFNARLDSKAERAIEFHEGYPIYEAAIKALVIEAIEFNISKQVSA